MTENHEHPVDSAAPALADRRFALLIGVEPDIERRLLGVSERSIAAKRDLQALQPLLQSPQLGNFSPVKTLTNPDRQQVEEEIYGQVVTAQNSGGDGDRVLLLYYSGQGFVDEEGTLYLAAANTRSNSLGELNKTTAVSLSSLRDLLQDCPVEQVIILDCAFAPANPRSSDRLDFAGQLGGSNRILLTASRTIDYTTAHKQAEQSLYTSFLVDAIATGCGLPAGTGVTTHSIHRYIQQRMQQAAPAIEPAIVLPHPEFELPISFAPAADAQLSYRQEVEARSQAGAISEFDRLLLDWRRDRLHLSSAAASAIEATVLKPQTTYTQNRQRYQDALKTIAQIQYPLRPATQAGLGHCRQQLGLPIDQAEAIATDVFAEPEQRYRQHLQQYEQHLAQQVQSGRWLDRHSRNELRYLEQQLHLLPQDLSALKQRHYPTPTQAIEDTNPNQPPYAERLKQYQRLFFDRFSPDRPLSPQSLTELESLQATLHLQDLDVALAEESTAQYKRELYEAQLQLYLQELLMADSSPAARAYLKQIQQRAQLADADIAIATQIAAALNPTADRLPVASPPVANPPVASPAVPAPAPAVQQSDRPISDRPIEEATPTVPSEAIEPADLPAASVPTVHTREDKPAEAVSPPSPPLEPIGARLRQRDSLRPEERTSHNRGQIDPLSSLTRPPRPATPSLAARLGDPSLPLRLLKTILFAIVSLVVGRFLIAQLLRILPDPLDQIIGIIVFGVIILIAWQAIDRLP